MTSHFVARMSGGRRSLTRAPTQNPAHSDFISVVPFVSALSSTHIDVSRVYTSISRIDCSTNLLPSMPPRQQTTAAASRAQPRKTSLISLTSRVCRGRTACRASEQHSRRSKSGARTVVRYATAGGACTRRTRGRLQPPRPRAAAAGGRRLPEAAAVRRPHGRRRRSPPAAQL